MSGTTQQAAKIQEAIEMFGEEPVSLAMELVAMSDADGAYTMLEDMGQFEAAQAVEFLYFSEEE